MSTTVVGESTRYLFQVLWGEQFDWETHQHYKDTPERWAKMMKELTTPEPFEFTTFDSDHDEMIVVSDIPFVSMCAHHLIPFVGYAHIGYIPDGQIVGLSKFARLVKSYARDLTVQEDLTDVICQRIEQELIPKGTAVVMKAEHMCMTIRGVQSPGTLTTTSKMTGVFLDATKGARQEFLTLALGQKGMV